LTLEGSHLHNRVNEEAPRRELRGNLLIARRLAIRSFELGVSGVADVVEFHRMGLESESGAGLRLDGAGGRWIPYPVEYKRGKPKLDLCDEVQLCAQAICLEEMLDTVVGEGSLFYGATQHRHCVLFDSGLRETTRQAASRLHDLFRSRATPRAHRQPKCRRCSLLEVCRPDAMSARRSARRFLSAAVRAEAEPE
jgi:CRISPR-associated exonuclease Cas4